MLITSEYWLFSKKNVIIDLFCSRQSLKTVSDAIAFADQILEVDTSQVEPLYSVLEDAQVELRPDEVTDGNIRADIIGNAVKTEEEYFVAPPGNIAIESKS